MGQVEGRSVWFYVRDNPAFFYSINIFRGPLMTERGVKMTKLQSPYVADALSVSEDEMPEVALGAYENMFGLRVVVDNLYHKGKAIELEDEFGCRELIIPPKSRKLLRLGNVANIDIPLYRTELLRCKVGDLPAWARQHGIE